MAKRKEKHGDPDETHLQLGSADGLRELRLVAFRWAVVEMQPGKLSIQEKRRSQKKREKNDIRFEYIPICSFMSLTWLPVPWQAENNVSPRVGAFNLSGISKIGRSRRYQ